MALSSMTGFARADGVSGPYAWAWELKSGNAKGFDYVGKPADLRASAIRDADYRRAGLPLPRHARLLTPWELLRGFDPGPIVKVALRFRSPVWERARGGRLRDFAFVHGASTIAECGLPFVQRDE